ncbi:hypothetical protein EDC61_11478 [Sulfuritortus calidifontis]|uniref:Ogr/Delta-like zinc finger protein n=1 Tax=Sulfuritortus calidifontis TaxID=1914471 RepID=A0A4R3JTI1_9PROT|nr:hypothetical protein EDC61_11478 [Sulfuritortus calidifontis]
MKCPACGSRSPVYGTRLLIESGAGLKLRYRRCPECGAKWKSYEEADLRTLKIKECDDGQRDLFEDAESHPDQG